MKFKIHYSKNFNNDYFIIEGDSIGDIKTKTKIEMDNRGLDEDKHNLWSEEI